MAMTLRLTDEEHEALRDRAALEGISMQGAGGGGAPFYVASRDRRDRIDAAAALVMKRHGEALRRLGE